MQSPLVSIIIPFYNEEVCLQRAIESALDQSYSNTEIILVNDGSTDGSKVIAEKYCDQFQNVHLINSTNDSLGAARNKGMALAKGTYLTFLDADDSLSQEMVTVSLSQILETNSDLAITRFTLVDENGITIKVSGWRQMPKTATPIDSIKGIYSNKIVPTAWGKLYKTEIVKNLKFPEKIWFEDNPFLLEFLFNSQKVSFVDNSLLNIYSRTNSITRRTLSNKRIVDINKAFAIELDVVEKYSTHEFQKQEIDQLIFINHFNAMLDTFMLYIIDKPKMTKEERKEIRECYEKHLGKIKELSKKRNLVFPLKKRLLFSFLSLPKAIGWNIPTLLIYLIKYRKVKYLRMLKG